MKMNGKKEGYVLINKDEDFDSNKGRCGMIDRWGGSRK